MGKRGKKAKAVKVSLIEAFNGPGKGRNALYAVMDDLVAHHHSQLDHEGIALAWHDGWKGDVDGRVRLGRAEKASDLDRELHRFDFVIVLNRAATSNFKPKQMRALIDHELCHCEVAKGKNGETKKDERGRSLLRIRKHDIEEFQEVIVRHGLWKGDLEAFARVAMEKAEQPLLV